MKRNFKTIIGLSILLLLSFSISFYLLNREEEPTLTKTIPSENFETEVMKEPEPVIEEKVEEIEVASLEELIENLGNDRILIITENIDITDGLVGLYNRFKWVPEPNSDDAYLEYGEENSFFSIKSLSYHTTFDFEQRDTLQPKDIFIEGNFYLNIKNTENLHIKGINSDITFTIGNQYSPVLAFENNNNLAVENINAVHNNAYYEECGPNAPVFQFTDDKSITITNCSLNGSGTEGIVAMDVGTILVYKTTIYNCNYRGIDLYRVNNCYINGAKIQNNDFESHIISLVESNIFIQDTEISGNIGYSGKLINFDSDSSFSFIDTYIKDNKDFRIDQTVIDELDSSNTVKFSDFEVSE